MITAIAFVLGIGVKSLMSSPTKIAVVDVKQVVNQSKDVAELRKLNQERSKELQEWVKNKSAEIEKKAGKTIPEIFAESGEDGFRRIESEVTAECSARRGVILLTGGGVVTRDVNYAPLRSNGRIYQICRPIEQLSREGRPLSQNADLHAMAEKRMPLYLAWAAKQIDNTRTPAAAAEEIWRDFCAYTRAEWAEFESAGNA